MEFHRFRTESKRRLLLPCNYRHKLSPAHLSRTGGEVQKKEEEKQTTFIELFCPILMTFTLLTNADWHNESRPASQEDFFQ